MSIKYLWILLTTVTILIIGQSNAQAFSLLTSDESYWDKEKLQIDYNSSSCPAGVSFPDDIEEAWNLTWNSVAYSSLRLEEGSTSASSSAIADRVLVICEALGTTGAAGVATITTLNGSIQSGLVKINSDVDWEALGKTALYLTIGHELGHAIGFGHSDDNFALMYFANTREKMAQDDVDAATYLYPRNDISDGPFACGTIGTNNTPSTNGLPPAAVFYLLGMCAITAVARQFALKGAKI